MAINFINVIPSNWPHQRDLSAYKLVSQIVVQDSVNEKVIMKGNLFRVWPVISYTTELGRGLGRDLFAENVVSLFQWS